MKMTEKQKIESFDAVIEWKNTNPSLIQIEVISGKPYEMTPEDLAELADLATFRI